MTILQLLTAHSAIALLVTAILIGLDTLIGVVKALGTSTFSWRKLPQFAETHVIPKLGGVTLAAVVQYVTAQSGAFLNMAVSVFFYGVVVAVNLALLRDILDKFGITLPADIPGASELKLIQRLLGHTGATAKQATPPADSSKGA